MVKGRTPYIKQAKSEILRFFERSNGSVYSEEQLQELLEQNRDKWHLPQKMSSSKFLNFLQQEGSLKQLSISSSTEPNFPIIRYSWGDVSPYSVALSLKSRSYLTHASATFIHGLTEQVPKRILVNCEQASKQNYEKGTLSQERIHAAFIKEQRESSLHYNYEEYDIQLLKGKFTGRLEVTSTAVNNHEVSVTKIERTLIDLAVRPSYGGGVYEVLRVYQRAKDLMSFPVLLATLNKLDYIYPYHQVIGFYMERAGYQKEQYEKLKNLGLNYDFYLAYGLRDKEFVSEWRLYVPKGF